jgi:hypothetical protein
MQRVICTLLWVFRRKANEGTSSYSPASRPFVPTLAILFVGSLLTYSAVAQTSPQSLTPQSRPHAISPEVLAIHARAKRPVATAPTKGSEAPTSITIRFFIFLPNARCDYPLRSFEVAELFLLVGAENLVDFGLHASISDDQFRQHICFPISQTFDLLFIYVLTADCK